MSVYWENFRKILKFWSAIIILQKQKNVVHFQKYIQAIKTQALKNTTKRIALSEQKERKKSKDTEYISVKRRKKDHKSLKWPALY